MYKGVLEMTNRTELIVYQQGWRGRGTYYRGRFLKDVLVSVYTPTLPFPSLYCVVSGYTCDHIGLHARQVCRCAGQPSSEMVQDCMYGGSGGAVGGRMSLGNTLFLLFAVAGVMTAVGYAHYKRTQAHMRDQVSGEYRLTMGNIETGVSSSDFGMLRDWNSP